MAFDFWNNPLVVSAFRVKYRRGGIFASLTLYVAFLSCACLGVWYAIPYTRGRLPDLPDEAKLQILFLGLLLFQIGLSTIMAMGITASAMSAEVNDATLDYQRLTRLTPTRILLGKLLGPAVTIYLMAFASLPFTFMIWALGVPAISIGTLLLLYVNVFSTALLGGSFGLVHTLKKKEPGQLGQGGFGILMGVVIFYGLMIQIGMMGGIVGALSQRHSAAANSLFLPIASLTGLHLYQDPWHFTLSFFEMPLPFLLVTPIAQLALASLCFVRMHRRLTNPMLPGFGKPLAYAVVLIVDIVVASVLYDSRPGASDLSSRTLRFWLCHAVVASYFIAVVTPDRALLSSWLWRFRGRYSLGRDLLAEDRSENIVVILTMCLLGVGLWALLVIWPAVTTGGWDEASAVQRTVVNCPLLVCVVTLSLGTFYQSWLFGVKQGAATMIFVLAFTDVVAYMAGSYYDLPWLEDVSLISHCSEWIKGRREAMLQPILSAHALLFLLSFVALRRGVRREEEDVQRKLQSMGLGPKGEPLPATT